MMFHRLYRVTMKVCYSQVRNYSRCQNIKVR